jgi:hypothetical protein
MGREARADRRDQARRSRRKPVHESSASRRTRTLALERLVRRGRLSARRPDPLHSTGDTIEPRSTENQNTAVPEQRQVDRAIFHAGAASVPRSIVDWPTPGIPTKTDQAVRGSTGRPYRPRPDAPKTGLLACGR